MFRTYAQAGVSAGAGTSAGGRAVSAAGPGGWHPTVLWMLGLTVAEIVVVGFLTRHLG